MQRWPVLRFLGAMACALAMVACGSQDGDSAGKEDPCPNGLCGSADVGIGSGAGGSSGPGGNPGAGPSGAGAGTGCVEAWLCTPWATNGTDDNGMRTCTDQNGCATSANKPAEAAQLPPLDLDFYKCKVEPVMDQKCSQLACHGTETGRALRIYARGRLRISDEIFTETGCLEAGKQVPSEQCIGGIECICWSGPHTASEWRGNYDAARGFGLDPSGATLAAGAEETSELLAQPVVGGKSHANIHLFRNDDPDYASIVQWLSGAALGANCNTNN